LQEEESVKNYFRQFFDLSDDINHKMKASVLYDNVLESNTLCKIDKTKLSSFKNRLSNYLKDLGLQKKRYNDGYYYYGIVSKDVKTAYMSDTIGNKNCIILKSYDELCKERNSLENDRLQTDFYIEIGTNCYYK
jgi:hypothetical protein